MEFKCASCGSTSQGEAGSCCGADRQESCPTCHNVKSACTCSAAAPAAPAA